MIKKYKFQDLISKTPKVRGIKTNEYNASGKYPIIDQGSKFIGGYTDDEKSLYQDTLPIIIFGDHTLAVKYIDFPFCAGADGTQIIKPNEKVVIGKFLYYAILNLNIKSLGYSRHFKVLKEATFTIPEIEDQKRIVKILDEADALRTKRKDVIDLLDNYLRSVFLEMFGDPVSNDKSWRKQEIKSFGRIVTGNTPSRNDTINFSSDHIEWIKTDNIIENKTYITPASEYLSEEGLSKARYVEPGSIIVACIAGSIESIGKCAITDRRVSFNQQINAIQPNSTTVNTFFLYWLIKISKQYIQSHATNGMKRILTKGNFEKIELIMPPIESQNKFAEVFHKTETLKELMIAQSIENENQFQALMQKAFAGEL